MAILILVAIYTTQSNIWDDVRELRNITKIILESARGSCVRPSAQIFLHVKEHAHIISNGPVVTCHILIKWAVTNIPLLKINLV
jgi:hypothetical protein